jgi:hypothetical protein
MTQHDHAHSTHAASVGVGVAAHDSIRWSPSIKVDKWHEDQVSWVREKTGILAPSGDILLAHVAPYEVIEAPGNLLTTAGLNRLTSLMIAAGGQGATNTATRLGVGNSATAETVGQTDLQAAAGATNRYFMTMDATYPQQANGVLTFKATFGTADGNFAWAEWCVDIGTPTVTAGTTVNANMLNRKVQSLGTKTSAGTWALTASITIS